jgi:hypothetical protein
VATRATGFPSARARARSCLLLPYHKLAWRTPTRVPHMHTRAACHTPTTCGSFGGGIRANPSRLTSTLSTPTGACKGREPACSPRSPSLRLMPSRSALASAVASSSRSQNSPQLAGCRYLPAAHHKHQSQYWEPVAGGSRARPCHVTTPPPLVARSPTATVATPSPGDGKSRRQPPCS